jgi:hypothetical protein
MNLEVRSSHSSTSSEADSRNFIDKKEEARSGSFDEQQYEDKKRSNQKTVKKIDKLGIASRHQVQEARKRLTSPPQLLISEYF